MGRPVNSKCWECSLLDSKTAQQIHGSTGDGCWNEKVCHRRRSHYRHRADVNQRRNSQYVSVKATRQQELTTASGIRPSAPPIALLYLYRGARKDAPLHAIAISVWQGDQKLEVFPPTHCMGMTNTQVRQYLQMVLQELNQKYGIKTFEPEIRYDPCFCPVHPCPLKAL